MCKEKFSGTESNIALPKIRGDVGIKEIVFVFHVLFIIHKGTGIPSFCCNWYLLEQSHHNVNVCELDSKQGQQKQILCPLALE